jgi:uncharacterized repeat protein (TIGR01451 family)
MYVKNLTDTWFRIYYYGQTSDRYANASRIPTPASQSATIKVYGMTPGTYTVEKWSTTETNKASQIISTSTITVKTDGIATVDVSSLGVDQAIKIKPAGMQPPNMALTLSADKTKASTGDNITYTVRYTNTGSGPASNVIVSVPVPSSTTFVSASSGGTYNATTKKVSWTISSLAAGASGTVTFQVKIN